MESKIRDVLLKDEWKGVEFPDYPNNHEGFLKMDYSPDYGFIMNCLKYAIENSEYSVRTLRLTDVFIEKNPSNQVIFDIRRRALEALGFDPYEELKTLDEFMMSNIKCYQFWCHRKWLLSKIDQYLESEEQSVFRILVQDTKNFHAWQFIIWFVRQFKKPEPFIQMIKDVLRFDIRNNSAWSALETIISNMKLQFSDYLDYAKLAFERNTSNSSAGMFLRFLAINDPSLFDPIYEFIEGKLKQEPDNCFLLSLLVLLNKNRNNMVTVKEMVPRILAQQPRLQVFCDQIDQ